MIFILQLVLLFSPNCLLSDVMMYDASTFRQEGYNWDDWVLTPVDDTLQGPGIDEWWLGDITDIKNFNLTSRLSFYVLSSHEIQFLITNSEDGKFNNYTHKNRINSRWSQYTMLRNNEGICLFENDNFVATFPYYPNTKINVTTREKQIWQTGYYEQVSVAYNISKEPTTIMMSPNYYYYFYILYVYLCSYCYLEVSLPKKGTQYLNGSETSFPELWKPIAISIENEREFTLRRKTKNGRYDGYWSFNLRRGYNRIGDLSVPEEVLKKVPKEGKSKAICACGFVGGLEPVCQKPCAPTVEFTHTEFNNLSLTFYWKVSKNCQFQHFEIFLDGVTYTTTRFSHSVENLDLCRNYTISIAAVLKNGTIGEKAYKTIETKVEEDIDFEGELTAVRIVNHSLNVTWKIPKKISACINSYYLFWQNETTKLDGVELVSSKHFFEIPLNCMNYNVSLVAKTLTKQYTKSIQHSVQPLATPELDALSLGSNGVNFTLKLDSEDKECRPTKLLIFCQFNIDTDERNVFFGEANITEFSPDNKYLITIKKLANYTNYNCSSFALNFKQTSPESFLVAFKKNEDVYSFSFPITFYRIFLKINRLDGYHNETHPKVAKLTHEVVPNDTLKHVRVCYWGQDAPAFCLQTQKTTTDLFLRPDQEYHLSVGFQTADFTSPLVYLSSFQSKSLEGDLSSFQTKSLESGNGLIYITFVSLGALVVVLIVMVYKIYQYVQTKRRLSINDMAKADSSLLLSEMEVSRAVGITEFDQLVSEEFFTRIKEEFKTFPVRKTQPLTVALQSANINKNRKRDQYLPYDCNRVVLKKLQGVGKGNYINANYIDGYKSPKAYIAAQGPKFCTIKNFWRMIWQQDVKIIVMASNTFEKKERMCCEYWPQTEGAIFECGKIIIKLLNEAIYDFYTFRKLEVCYNSSTKQILQFQLKWISEFESCYPNNFLPVLKFLREHDTVSSPILIHSGYGVGRTGAIILCDLALRMIEDKGKADFYTLTQTLRNQRLSLVKDLEHYALAHFTIKEYIKEKQSPFDKSTLKEQLDYLEVLCYHDTILQEMASMKRDTLSFDASVLRYGGSNRYLVSKEPSAQDFSDFWCMVAHKGIEYITFLNKKMPFENDCFNGAKKVIQFSQTKTMKTSFCIIRKCSLLIYESRTKQILHDIKNIFVFEFSDWKDKKLVPNSIENFNKMVDAVNKLEVKPSLVLCGDGCTASGLFVALAYALEQYKAELKTDVCAAVRIIRRGGKKFVETEKQLKFLYSCISEFSKNYESYQNVDLK